MAGNERTTEHLTLLCRRFAPWYLAPTVHAFLRSSGSHDFNPSVPWPNMGTCDWSRQLGEAIPMRQASAHMPIVRGRSLLISELGKGSEIGQGLQSKDPK